MAIETTEVWKCDVKQGEHCQYKAGGRFERGELGGYPEKYAKRDCAFCGKGCCDHCAVEVRVGVWSALGGHAALVMGARTRACLGCQEKAAELVRRLSLPGMFPQQAEGGELR